MNLFANLRYTFRQITKSPGFFAVAIAALALGIGANTAIFSAVEAVLLKPLPFAQPDRLAIVWEDMSFLGFANNTPAPANYLDWRAQNHVFTDMAATRFVTASLTGDGQPEQLSGKKVTPNFFDVLGVQPIVGRPFTVEEDKAQSPVVVLGYNLWRRRFGGDESIIGRTILMNGIQTKVVGVMPKDFFFGDRKNSDYWVPMAFTPEQWARRQSHFLTVVARLKPGVTKQQAQKDMERVAADLQKQYPESNAKLGAVVVPLQQDYAGDARSGLLVLQVASVFVLLIACSNLANLLLARSTGRRREIAVRLALGASRWQIASQLLTESLVLSAAGGLLGLWIGKTCWSLFGSLVPEQAGGGFEWNSARASLHRRNFDRGWNAVWIRAGAASDTRATARIAEGRRPRRRIARRIAAAGHAGGRTICVGVCAIGLRRTDDPDHVESAETRTRISRRSSLDHGRSSAGKEIRHGRESPWLLPRRGGRRARAARREGSGLWVRRAVHDLRRHGRLHGGGRATAADGRI